MFPALLAAAVISSCGGSKSLSDPGRQIEEQPFEPDAAQAEAGEAQPVDQRAVDRKIVDMLTGDEQRKEAPVFETVYFGLDESSLTSEARAVLAGHAEVLKANPGISLMVEGHCDERGTIEYNLALGQRRAAAVKQYLVNYGIPAGRIFTISYGKERPADPGHDEAAWAKNRRAGFEIMGR